MGHAVFSQEDRIIEPEEFVDGKIDDKKDEVEEDD